MFDADSRDERLFLFGNALLGLSAVIVCKMFLLALKCQHVLPVVQPIQPAPLGVQHCDSFGYSRKVRRKSSVKTKYLGFVDFLKETSLINTSGFVPRRSMTQTFVGVYAKILPYEVPQFPKDWRYSLIPSYAPYSQCVEYKMQTLPL